MSTREQFGKYLLLKKLTEDPLGESFRAGMLSDKGMERVVLLRVWNGQGIDGERLWQACAPRAGLQRALRSPNIGEGIEMGAVQGIPYVAYDYISGRNLATLMEQAEVRASPIPTEHGLLITERVALALALAAEHRFDGERIRHGFVVPHLVMLSNEGESRLLGFEMAPALRMFAGSPVIRQHFGRYLAPEAMAGAEPHRADDTYSLGVLLYELLTGSALPPPAVDGYGSIVEGAVLATGGEVPEPLRQLMRHSLTPREQRIADVVAWHKALNTWMFEGYNPTTFNLAFFMHNLFRQEIELESEEIEVERTMQLPVVAPATAPVPVPAPVSAPAAAVTSELETAAFVPPPPADHVPAPAPPAKGGGKMGLWLALAALLLAAIGAGGWYFMQQREAASAPPPVVVTPPPPPPPPPMELMGPPVPEELLARGEDAEGAPAADERTELQTKIDELVDERTSALETELRAKMDQQLAALRDQLDAAQKTASDRGEELRRRQAAEDAGRQPEAGAAGQGRPSLETVAETGAGNAAAGTVPPSAPAGAGDTGAGDTGAGDTGSGDVGPSDVGPSDATTADPATTATVAVGDVASAEEALPPPPSSSSRVRRGDLIEPGHPGLVPPKRLRTPPVRFPELARRAKKSDVEVLVKVLVDENGKVIDSQLQGKKAGYGFDGEALKVARRTTYEPARVGDVPVKMWVTMRVKFQ